MIAEGTELSRSGHPARRPLEAIHVLYVEDDEADFLILRKMLAGRSGPCYHVSGVATLDEALEVARADVYLVDQYLGSHTGFDVIRSFRHRGISAPIIVITGQGDCDLDRAAEAMGAADYLVKGEFDARLLERSIRFAVARHRDASARAELAALVEASTDATLSVSLDGRIRTWNPAADRAFGRHARDVLDSPLADVVCSATREALTRGLDAVRAGRVPELLTCTCLRPDGTRFEALITLFPIRAPGGSVEAVGAIVRDVTEALRRERALRQSQALFHAFMDNGPMLACMVDERERFVYANRLAEGLLGRPAERITGFTPADLLPPEVASKMSAADDEVRRSQAPHSAECHVPGPDGRTREWRTVRFPVILGDACHVGCVALDVTEQRRLERLAQQTRQMESLGRLAGGVAHDFNNVITVVSGYAELLLQKSALGPWEADAVRTIQEAAERSAGLTAQLLAFSRRQLSEPRVIDVCEVVRGVRALLSPLVGEHIDLRMDLCSQPLPVLLDPVQLEQVVLNLVVNARDAQPCGGSVRIETRPASGDDGEPLAELLVADEGHGMDEETAARIFEPFFTTKAEGRGTGLGLATCYGIVQSAGGRIELDTAPGRGTRFRIMLPRAEEATTDRSARRPAARAAGGGQMVLVVEDEAPVRRLAALILEQAGYAVLLAGSGEAALALLDTHPEIRLVLADVVLPGGTRDLRSEFARRARGVPVLHMSGCADETLEAYGLRHDVPAFVAKPFTASSLLDAVAAVLGAEGGVDESIAT